MARKEKAALADLEARLGYKFRDPGLARRALTHPSSSHSVGGDRLESYERLEFLGDRVLGLAVAQMLYVAYPTASEGALSVRFNALVRRETCAEIAKDWDVGPHILLDPGESLSGGRKKAAILADVCESLIGALLIDSGYDAAAGLVERSWRPRMLANLQPERDAKSMMQEWAHARGLREPRYIVIERSGPEHMPRFTIEVSLEGYEPAQGSAASKRGAEQIAAQAFMTRCAATDERHD